MYANRVRAVKALVRVSGNAPRLLPRYHPIMGKKDPKPRNNLRAWRLAREMTLEALAEAVGTTKGVISELELSKKGLSHKWLLRLAPALKTTPGMILDYHPDEVDLQAMNAFLGLNSQERAQVLQIIGVLHRKAS